MLFVKLISNFVRKKKVQLVCYTAGILFNFLSAASAQQNISQQNQVTPDFQRGSLLTAFIEKEETIGIPFLSRYWMTGVVELSNHQRLPAQGDLLLFNYDKMKNTVYMMNRDKKITYLPANAVLSFDLLNRSDIFSFEKVKIISAKFFLTAVIKSDNGYSLYKRLFTRLIRANFSNEGYYTEGKKYDEYVDYYEYYITYPGNRSFRKIYLREKYIWKVLKDESKLLEAFFNLHDNEINEESLIGIIQYINDKKFPD
jgi:hypothetical protein